jgi:hypothetical protein
MMSKKTAEQRIAEIRRELMKSIDYRAPNSFIPYNSVSILADEILEAGYISKELQARIGKILGERWMKWK